MFPGDGERFIHIPTAQQTAVEDKSALFTSVLAELGVEVSTGPVVDFRVKNSLRKLPGSGTVPLLYPTHFSGRIVEWPKPEGKKPNALAVNSETKKWLYPNGTYVVVRRFSSKEERRRIIASVVSSTTFDAELLGFENHLNVFHYKKRGLPDDLARGLALFLNSTAVDEHFRRFSGHTQVNATDLRTMKYLPREKLAELGKNVEDVKALAQDEIDRRVESVG